MEKRLGFIGIIIDNRHKNAHNVNTILSEFGESIIARTGIPYKNKNCCVITLIVNMSTDEIGSLTGRIGNFDGVSVKSALAKQ